MSRLRLLAAIAMAVLAAIAGPTAAQPPVTQESAPQATQDLPTAEQAAQEPGAAPSADPQATGLQSGADGASAAGENSEAEKNASAADASTVETPEIATLTVSTWGGAYGQALQNAVLTPFGSDRGVEIKTVPHNGTGSGADVLELTAAAVEAGCNSGDLVKIDALSLAGDAGATQDDFIAGSVQPCGVGSFVWSAVMAVNGKALKGGEPTSLQDVFNTKRFPGRRAFIKSPRYLLEMALIADGVTPADVYQQLSSDEGVERSLAKLDSLGDALTWHASAKETLEQLTDATVVFAQTFNGQAFYGAAFGAPIRIIWDGQIYSVNFWAIPADGAAQELAKEFVAHAMAPQRLAAVAEETGYGPTRRSAVALVQQHPRVAIELAPYLPTQADNFARAVAFDEAWWSENQARIEARFAAWLEARELQPVAKPERKPE